MSRQANDLKIAFVDATVADAPLRVLDHLYYYTVQYGISVRQFTGRNAACWNALPSRLRAARRPRELEAILQELDVLTAGKEERTATIRSQRKRWAGKEIVLSAQLCSLLAALPDTLLADMFGRLTARTTTPSRLRLVTLKNAGFVEPDALLLGDNRLLMIEVKTRGLDARGHRYAPQQLLNYARLAIECRTAADPQLPHDFAHLIVVPSRAPMWLEKHSQWVTAFDDLPDGRLAINAEAAVSLGRDKTQARWGPKLVETLKQLPIYYRSWADLARASSDAIGSLKADPYREHWQSMGRQLQTIAERAGKYALSDTTESDGEEP
jgi:hypothetical protein